MEAITWAMNNMSKFPAIADLRLCIEGSDEDHANKAWAALGSMISSDRAASFTLCDLALVRTIEHTWTNMNGARFAFARPMDQFGRDAMKRAFRLAYLDNYKRRDRLRQEMGYAVVLNFVADPQPKNSDYVLIDYMVDSNYALVEVSRRTIRALPRGTGMTPEQREKLDGMLSGFGKETRQIVPPRIIRDDADYLERARRAAAARRKYGPLTILPDDSSKGNVEDLHRGNGTLDAGGEPV